MLHTPIPSQHQADHRRLAESDAAYPAIYLNDNWRVIVCRDGIQWIVQFRNRRSRLETVAREDWRGRAYCRSRAALIRCCEARAGTVSPSAAAALAALPEWTEQSTHWPPAFPDRRASMTREPFKDRPRLSLPAFRAGPAPAAVIDSVGLDGKPTGPITEKQFAEHQREDHQRVLPS